MHVDKAKADGAFAELERLYAEADRLLQPYVCEASAECCKFGITGREPYLTPVEAAYLARALKAKPLPKARSPLRLPLAGVTERRCELLGADDRCQAYDARPFGCRTFFCDRVSGPAKLPRAAVQALGRRIASLAEGYAPRDPTARPMSRQRFR